MLASNVHDACQAFRYGERAWGVQFHPEFRSRPQKPHPLFRDFVGAATEVLREGGQIELPLAEREGQ